jgi:hypothetical protein
MEQSPFNGNGTISDPFQVGTAEQLNEIRNFSSWNFLQTADIDLSGFQTDEGWEPIGSLDYPFEGSFDGNGFKITGLKINRPNVGYVGLFGFVGSSGGGPR